MASEEVVTGIPLSFPSQEFQQAHWQNLDDMQGPRRAKVNWVTFQLCQQSHTEVSGSQHKRWHFDGILFLDNETDYKERATPLNCDTKQKVRRDHCYFLVH